MRAPSLVSSPVACGTVAASPDGQLKLKPLSGVVDAAFTPDDREVVLLGEGAVLHVYRVSDGGLVRTVGAPVPEHSGPEGVLVTDDAFVYGSEDGDARLEVWQGVARTHELAVSPMGAPSRARRSSRGCRTSRAL